VNIYSEMVRIAVAEGPDLEVLTDQISYVVRQPKIGMQVRGQHSSIPGFHVHFSGATLRGRTFWRSAYQLNWYRLY
jgi:hypothetical protein